MRFNPDGSFDGCEVDEEARDGLEKYYNLLTWSIVSSSSKDNAFLANFRFMIMKKNGQS